MKAHPAARLTEAGDPFHETFTKKSEIGVDNDRGRCYI